MSIARKILGVGLLVVLITLLVKLGLEWMCSIIHFDNPTIWTKLFNVGVWSVMALTAMDWLFGKSDEDDD